MPVSGTTSTAQLSYFASIQSWLNQALTNHPYVIGISVVVLVIAAIAAVCYYYSIIVASRK